MASFEYILIICAIFCHRSTSQIVRACEFLGPCTHICQGEDACKSDTLLCTPGEPCTIVCTGKSACTEANILGQGASDVEMRCIGEDACKPARFNCGTGKCLANCAAGLNICDGMTVNTNGAASFNCIGQCPLNIQALIYTLNPTTTPSSHPTTAPTIQIIPATSNPTTSPSRFPSITPTKIPTQSPSINPTGAPTFIPSKNPSSAPTNMPSLLPSITPTHNPSASPTKFPTTEPTLQPTQTPSTSPSSNPSTVPTASPSSIPSSSPTLQPSLNPSTSPSKTPSNAPSSTPSNNPSSSPTLEPTNPPTYAPSFNPSLAPTNIPSTTPTLGPTIEPTSMPSLTPSYIPSISPSFNPTMSPTNMPSFDPSAQPTINPTVEPTFIPTTEPTSYPSKYPSISPSASPSKYPTISPTQFPTMSPNLDPTTDPTLSPTMEPSINPTKFPSTNPSISPSDSPTLEPTLAPTIEPSINPTIIPSTVPTGSPSYTPTLEPTVSLATVSNPTTERPSLSPTMEPTISTKTPSSSPSMEPSTKPTISPSKEPSMTPSNVPTTKSPTVSPTFESIDCTIPRETNIINNVNSDTNVLVQSYGIELSILMSSDPNYQSKFNQIETRNMIQILREIVMSLIMQTESLSDCTTARDFYMHIDTNGIVNGSIFVCTQYQQQRLLSKLNTNNIICPMINTMQTRMEMTMPIEQTKLTIQVFTILEPQIFTTQPTRAPLRTTSLKPVVTTTNVTNNKTVILGSTDAPYYGQHGSDMRFVLLTIISTLAITAIFIGCAICCLQAYKKRQKKKKKGSHVPIERSTTFGTITTRDGNGGGTFGHLNAITAASIQLHKMRKFSDSVGSESGDRYIDVGMDAYNSSNSKRITILGMKVNQNGLEQVQEAPTSEEERTDYDQDGMITGTSDTKEHEDDDSSSSSSSDEDSYPTCTGTRTTMTHTHKHDDHDHGVGYFGSCKCSCHLAMTDNTQTTSGNDNNRNGQSAPAPDVLLENIVCDPEYYDVETFGATLGLIGMPQPPNVLDDTFNKLIIESTVNGRQCCKLQEALWRAQTESTEMTKDAQNVVVEQTDIVNHNGDSKPSTFELPRYAVV